MAIGLREKAYAVDIATDGEDGWCQASINDYDVVILDVTMPHKTGFEVCAELRKEGIAVPVLMLTAREDKIFGLELGADDYLTKPFELGELLARLRARQRRKGKVRQSLMVIADLDIDPNSQQVWRGGSEIPLTTKEYALLEYLAREKGKVVGRAEIGEHVWDENFDA